jgi:uncharacterized protein (TIGR02996 family)
MPRYELVTEKRNRFWDITLEGTRVVVRHGRRGTNGTYEDESLLSLEDARARFDQLVAEKLAEGYRLVSTTPPVTTPKRLRRLRRFEDGNSFREVELDGLALTQRTGLLKPAPGTEEPDPETTGFDTLKEASEAFERLVLVYGKRHTLTASQDTEVSTANQPQPATVAQSPGLEAAILATPDDPKPWAVYTDFLLSEGDARGDYAVAVRGGKSAELERLLRSAGTTLFGRLAPFARTLRLEHNAAGFPTAAELRALEELSLEAATRELLALPLSRFITSLGFGPPGRGDEESWAPTVRAVVESARAPNVRSLRFPYDSEQSGRAGFGDFSSCWRALPALEELHLRSDPGGVLGDIDAPRLKRFVRASNALSADELKSIVDARWPALEHLELWLGAPDHGGQATAELLAPLLRTRALPALTSLGLVNSALVDELLPMLVASPLLPRLRRLDLSFSGMTSADRLVAHAKSLAHLEVLDVQFNHLDPDECDRIAAVLPQAVVSGQYGYDEEEDEDEDRYDAVGE